MFLTYWEECFYSCFLWSYRDRSNGHGQMISTISNTELVGVRAGNMGLRV